MELVPIVEITLGIFAGLLALALAVSYISARLKRKTLDDFQQGNHAKIINLNGIERRDSLFVQPEIRDLQAKSYNAPVPEISPRMRESSPAFRKTPSKFTVLNNNIYPGKNEAADQPQQEIKKYPSGNRTGAVAMFK